MAGPADDLGTIVPVRTPARRVVSLVPSLTESVASVDRDAIVGATDWCTHPPDLTTTRVRGTKNPNLATIVRLAPDIVLANKEENRRKDVQALRAAGIPVWVTEIETVAQALDSLQRMFAHALGWDPPRWLEQARNDWQGGIPSIAVRTVIPIWRDPWMVVGSRTFTGDLARRLGLENCFVDSPDRYPHTSVPEILGRRPDLVVLPDEPYPFSHVDGPEAFPDSNVRLIEGRLLTWYGPSLAVAKQRLSESIGDDVGR